MAFTALNDLSTEYILSLILEDEKQIIQLLNAAVNDVECDAECYGLVTELLKSEQRHVRVLQRHSDDRIRTAPRRDGALDRQESAWPAATESGLVNRLPGHNCSQHWRHPGEDRGWKKARPAQSKIMRL
jgi:hypothetical protein